MEEVFLKEGDKVAIISPATKVKREYIDGACEYLKINGLTPVVYPHVNGLETGSFASDLDNRIYDLKEALADKEIRAILCARGGYGCQQIAAEIPVSMIAENPKLIIGFSDISALHALWLIAGVKSIHGPMAKHLTLTPNDCARRLISNLRGEFCDITTKPHPLNTKGEGRGILIGGNLAVLNGLAGTALDILSAGRSKGAVLFIEDIGENIYEVDRIITRLAMCGTLNAISGLIIGQFTEYHEDLNYSDMEEMFHHRLSRLRERYGFAFPVAYDFPIGHVDDNYPMVEGAMVRLNVSDTEVRLDYDRCDFNRTIETRLPQTSPTLNEVQHSVDKWIKEIGKGYFSELTNMALLTEETGELARLIARIYGEQKSKPGDMESSLSEELADVLWVAVCLANQTGTNLTDAFRETIRKKTSRDKKRFQ